MGNIINWFEIPVVDMDRAIKFYSEVFSYSSMQQMDFGGFKMAFFPAEQGSLGGALCKGDGYKPTQDGVVIYFSVQPDLNVALSKVEAAGGKVIVPKRIITEEYGYMGLFIDSEGNRVAMHSQN